MSMRIWYKVFIPHAIWLCHTSMVVLHAYMCMVYILVGTYVPYAYGINMHMVQNIHIYAIRIISEPSYIVNSYLACILDLATQRKSLKVMQHLN